MKKVVITEAGIAGLSHNMLYSNELILNRKE
jgi:hypothetical protein